MVGSAAVLYFITKDINEKIKTLLVLFVISSWLVYITIVDFTFYQMFLGLTHLLRQYNSITSMTGLLWYLKFIFIVTRSTVSPISTHRYLEWNLWFRLKCCFHIWHINSLLSSCRDTKMFSTAEKCSL